MTPRTVVVFTGRYASDVVTEHVEAIARRFPTWDVHVLQESAPQSRLAYLRTKLRQLRNQPISYPVEVVAKLASLPRRVVNAVKQRRRRQDDSPTGIPYDVAQIDLPNVTYHACAFLHSAKTIELVRSLDAWLGVSIGAPILREKLFALPKLGTINIHKSLLPSYRGMPPGFWELHDGAQSTGVSVHWVAKKLDAGDLILQQELPIAKYSTPRGLSAQLDVLGTEVLLEALRQIDAGTASRAPLHTTGTKLHRYPSYLKESRVHRRCWKRRRSNRLLRKCKAVVKSIVLAGYTFAWAPLRNLVLSIRGKCRVSVLLYHRVDDNFLDDVSVGIEQFERHLEILERNYEVLDLASFLASPGKPRRKPAVVITFDDGYACNYLAAVLLRRHGLPATFFLSTGMIGTEKPFPHDLISPGHRVPALDWPQVAQMARWGYTFGVHTVNHARLSAVPLEEAMTEVADAQTELRDRVDGQAMADCLAYPYGKETDISAEVRHSLDRAGVRYILSAYGGTNAPDWDRLDILRCGVDAQFSDLGFRAVVEGWRVSRG